MNKSRVGLLTIGQSPREDIMSEIKFFFNQNLEVIEMGLLDDLNFEEIKDLQPKNAEYILVSRLRNGNQIQLSEKKIYGLLPNAIELMKIDNNVQVVGVLCTHDFPKVNFSFPVIFPSIYLNFLINSVLKANKFGIVVPSSDQIRFVKEKWKKKDVVVTEKSPYSKGISWKEITQDFIQEKVEAVILDCIGYTMSDKREIKNLMPVPVLLPRTILVFAINQLF